jgi:hypothetical protein
MRLAAAMSMKPRALLLTRAADLDSGRGHMRSRMPLAAAVGMMHFFSRTPRVGTFPKRGMAWPVCEYRVL